MVAPSLDSVSEAREGAEAEQKFWGEHYKALLDKYPDQFVAVQAGSVVAASPDLAQLVQLLQAKGLDKVWVQFITADPRRVLL